MRALVQYGSIELSGMGNLHSPVSLELAENTRLLTSLLPLMSPIEIERF